MSYTKGPWEQVVTARFGPDDFEGLNIESPNENTVICELAGGLPLIEIQANAHLIAVAPDLIDRLKETNAALLNWKRLIEAKGKADHSQAMTKTEEMIAYNCGLVAKENAEIIHKAEGKD